MQQFTIKDISSEALKNYFNIFGFVKISGFFIDEIDNISKEFDLAMNKKFGNKKANDRNYFYPQFVEHDQNLASILELEKIEKVITNLLGENPIYTGSDGNIFSDSTPWHRDYLNKNRSCKMLVYLDEIDGDSGALRVIPGSHFVDDKYSSFLGDGLNWPEPPYEGGFDEKCFFGKGHNPRKIGENNLIPNHVVPNNPGDIIIFNHNLIHCTNYALVPSFKYDKRLGFKKKNIRRMFGLHFFASPSNIKDEALQKKLTKDMEQLFLIELKTFKLKNRFGPCVAESKSEKIKNYIKEIKHI
ncbi:MAG: phytanoyl-CoA dioxygenase family protein [Rickettsiales bacterium]|nr:phytanoyl-CoA dioxygenase family protein [Rickettsiales bacterium]